MTTAVVSSLLLSCSLHGQSPYAYSPLLIVLEFLSAFLAFPASPASMYYYAMSLSLILLTNLSKLFVCILRSNVLFLSYYYGTFNSPQDVKRGSAAGMFPCHDGRIVIFCENTLLSSSESKLSKLRPSLEYTHSPVSSRKSYLLGPLTGEDSQICLFGGCLLMT